MRPSRSFPLQAVLVLAGIVALLRLAAFVPSRFPLFRPDVLGAALFLYSPFLYYRRGRLPSWTRIEGPGRSASVFLGLGAGGVLAYLAFAALPFAPIPPPAGGSAPPFWEFLLGQAVLVALPEEVFFRGYLYDALEERGWEPVTASSLLFAAAHLAIHASAYRALTFFPSLLFGLGRKASGNIHVPVLLHLLFNLLPHLLAARG